MTIFCLSFDFCLSFNFVDSLLCFNLLFQFVVSIFGLDFAKRFQEQFKGRTQVHEPTANLGHPPRAIGYDDRRGGSGTAAVFSWGIWWI
jgi:hypothetical protein